MAGKNIVIVGAGYAGVSAAKKLAKKYKKDDSVSITLIDRNSYHTMLTELHEVAAHRVEPDAVQLDLRKLFNRTKVNLVTDNVTHVDYESQKVMTEHGSFEFDHLILGMGAEPNDFGTPGVEKHAFTLWSWEDAVQLREHIESTVQKAATIRDEKTRRAMLTFSVCGSGFTGIEMVGELVEWKKRLAKDNKIDEDEFTLQVIEAAPTILNMLERKDANKAEAYLQKHGVQIIKDSPIVQVNAESFELKSGETIPTHTLIWTAGVQANSDTKDYGLSKGRAGRLNVNGYMEAEGLDNVYVVGDLAYYEENPGEPIPQIVEAAEQTAHTAAENIIADINGGEKVEFKGNYHGVMVSIGSRYGVADLNGIHLSGWFANFVKHLVNLFYFFTLRSGYYMVQYVKHEFFHTKDKRNIFRDMPSRYGNALWSVPLRLFVGGFWLYEGAAKAFGEDSWITNNVVNMPFDWLHSDATSGASEWDEGDAAATIISEMPGWFEGIMKIMIPTPEIAVMMQKIVVIAELAIGLALIFGIFTWIASFISAKFIAMFVLTAMLGWDQLWVLPASIALLNGSGRTLGLDYWVIPGLRNKLGNWWYGKERAIYTDKTSIKK
ncbi:FAD-dependent oxidoreductase [Texcoconibacillus texcoconensis]|uniref:NADH:ubiquinone reductase (non-electrogenic) n=1 Tax=Texcoconibacillus texcoconensis TaxID=1095777 RepID=A0A840QQW5_9BACI|nr:FAD-dependent oxidoreductase [Texcoconibacillus texcoconensis]MBB5173728.1 NADH dehydrogenase [Texcoconibacillus texcoconensis]